MHFHVPDPAVCVHMCVCVCVWKGKGNGRSHNKATAVGIYKEAFLPRSRPVPSARAKVEKRAAEGMETRTTTTTTLKSMRTAGWAEQRETGGRGQAVITPEQQMSPHEDDHAAAGAVCTQTTSQTHTHAKLILLSGQREKRAAASAWKLNFKGNK